MTPGDDFDYRGWSVFKNRITGKYIAEKLHRVSIQTDSLLDVQKHITASESNMTTSSDWIRIA